MNESYKMDIEKYLNLSKRIVALAEEYHKTKAITAATELADNIYELIQL